VFSTVNVATGRNAPMIHQLADLFPDAKLIDRTSINAWTTMCRLLRPC